MFDSRTLPKVIVVSFLLAAVFGTNGCTGDDVGGTVVEDTTISPLETDVVETTDAAVEIDSESDMGPEIVQIVEEGLLCANGVDDDEDGKTDCGDQSCAQACGECIFDKDCNDGVPCTGDYCDSGTYQCRHIPSNTECDDGKYCTIDTCKLILGCSNTPSDLKCEDGDYCTDDTCDSQTGDCEFASLDDLCEDGDACTTNVCHAQDGCVISPTICDDGDLGTADMCVPAIGCVSEEVDCDGGLNTCASTPCKTASCVAGKCVYEPMECDDGASCTTDVCQAGECLYIPNDSECPSVPGNACLDSICQPFSDCGFQTIVCDDKNPCTADACNPATGYCTFNSIPGCCLDTDQCNDGNACTVDICGTDNKCQEPIQLDCDDGKGFTADMCLSGIGCVHTPEEGYCTSDDMCNSADPCIVNSWCDLTAGICHYSEKECNDGVECTEDYCENGICKVWEDHTFCAENVAPGLFCNGWFDYEPGVSVSGCIDECNNELDCDDNPCTDTWCNWGEFGSVCQEEFYYSDGNDCTGDFGEGTCYEGTCVECQFHWDCDDGNPCTEDICIPLEGAIGGGGGAGGGGGPIEELEDQGSGECSHEPLTTSAAECDGSGCTQDSCLNGLCIPGDINCSAYGNSCDVGTCVDDGSWSYCEYETAEPGEMCFTDSNAVGECNDSGICLTVCSKDLDCDDGNPCTIDECDVFYQKCAHDWNSQKWDCLSCNEDKDCTERSVCDDISGQYRMLTTGICLEGACELEPKPSLCPYCSDSFYEEYGGKVAVCQEEYLCYEQQCIEPPTFKVECESCNDDIEITVDLCTEDGGCVYEPQNWCVQYGEYLVDGECQQCQPGGSCHDGNPCVSAAECDQWGGCSEMLDYEADECVELQFCINSADCDWGNCKFNRCIPPKACETNADCPSNGRRHCYEGVCQTCMPVTFGEKPSQQGCSTSNPICQPFVQISDEDWVDETGDTTIKIYYCVPE